VVLNEAPAIKVPHIHCCTVIFIPFTLAFLIKVVCGKRSPSCLASKDFSRLHVRKKHSDLQKISVQIETHFFGQIEYTGTSLGIESNPENDYQIRMGAELYFPSMGLVKPKKQEPLLRICRS
jgi:hypothetical protein